MKTARLDSLSLHCDMFSRPRQIRRLPLITLTMATVLVNLLGAAHWQSAPATTAQSTCCCARRGGECRCGHGCCGAPKQNTVKTKSAARLWVACPAERPDGLPAAHNPDWLVAAATMIDGDSACGDAPAAPEAQFAGRIETPPTPPPRLG